MARAQGRQQRVAIGGADLDLHVFLLYAADVAHRLQPDGVFHAAAHGHDIARFDAALAEDFKVLVDAVADALEDGLVDVAARVQQIEAEDHALGFGVVDGRALSAEVGQHHQAVRTGGDALGQLHHLCVGVPALALGALEDVHGKVVAEPARQRAGAAHARGDGVGALEHVGAAPDAAVLYQFVHHVDDEDGRAVHNHHVAGLGHAGGETLRGGVRRAGRHLRAHRQTGLARGLLVHCADDFVGPVTVGELVAAADAAQVLFPILILDGIEGDERAAV